MRPVAGEGVVPYSAVYIAAIGVILLRLGFPSAVFGEPVSDTTSMRRRPRAMVVGCENRIAGRDWRDSRIGFGVTALIAESIADDGGLVLVEEKPAVRARLAELRTVLWEKGQRRMRDELQVLRGDSVAHVIGRLVYFGAPRESVSFGGFGAARNQVVIHAEVDLVFPDGERFTGSGRGEAVREANTALLTFRDDQPFYDQTTVGVALREAVRAATRDALENYRDERGD